MEEEFLEIVNEVCKSGLQLNEIPSKISIFLQGISEFVLPILCVIALIIASTCVMFSHREGWRKVSMATIGAVIMYLTVDWLTSLKQVSDKYSKKGIDILYYLEGIAEFLKMSFDGVLPIASVLAILISASLIMFSNQTGWKRFLNAFWGSSIAFGAVLIINTIIQKFNSLF